MELHCTPASVSQRIRSLEAIFGRPLFHRFPNGVMPTDIADAYLANIAEALDQLSTISDCLARAAPKRTVNVCVPVTFAALWLAPRIEAFYQEYPDIDVRLSCTIWNSPSHETADFQIHLLASESRLPNLKRLTRDHAHVVCAPGYAGARDTEETGVYFPDLPLITLIAKYDYWQMWLQKSRPGRSATVGASRLILASRRWSWRAREAVSVCRWTHIPGRTWRRAT